MASLFKSPKIFYGALSFVILWVLAVAPGLPYFFGHQEYLDQHFVPTTKCPKVSDCDTGGPLLAILIGWILALFVLPSVLFLTRRTLRPGARKRHSLISLVTWVLVGFSAYLIYDSVTTVTLLATKVIDTLSGLFLAGILFWYRALARP